MSTEESRDYIIAFDHVTFWVSVFNYEAIFFMLSIVSNGNKLIEMLIRTFERARFENTG